MTQKKFILDAYPFIVFLRKQKNWETISDLFAKGIRNEIKIMISVINLGEVYYAVFKDSGAEEAEAVIDSINYLSISIVDADWELTKQAAIFKSKGGISYADCFAASLAKRENAILVTGDKEFQQLEKEIEILWI